MKKVLALILTCAVASTQAHAIRPHAARIQQRHYNLLLHKIEKSTHPGDIKKLLAHHIFTDVQLDNARALAREVATYRQHMLDELEQDYRIKRVVKNAVHKKPSFLRSCAEVGAGIGMISASVVSGGLLAIPGTILLGCGVKNFSARHKHAVRKHHPSVSAEVEHAHIKYGHACAIEALLEQTAVNA